jgi:hypothetical protein
MEGRAIGHNFERTDPGTIPARFGLICILSQNVPKFELYKHNDELFNIYYGIFYDLLTLPILTDYAN